MVKKHDYSIYAEAYLSGVPASELAKDAGMNPGQMYRGLKSLGIKMRGRSESGKARKKTFGEENPNYKGGKVIDKHGYVRLRGPWKFKLEHRLVAEQTIGRTLSRNEVVHHINGDRTDNRPENLHVCTASEHRLIHIREIALAECGHADWRRCHYCKEYDSPENLGFVKRQSRSYHKACAAEYQRLRKENLKNSEAP